jgi:hypothetical protein
LQAEKETILYEKGKQILLMVDYVHIGYGWVAVRLRLGSGHARLGGEQRCGGLSGGRADGRQVEPDEKRC